MLKRVVITPKGWREYLISLLPLLVRWLVTARANAKLNKNPLLSDFYHFQGYFLVEHVKYNAKHKIYAWLNKYQ